MNFIKKLFSKKEEPIKNVTDFWKWFVQHEKQLFQVIKARDELEEKFFNRISPKLDQLGDGYFYVTGMTDDNIAELIFTADGNINYIAAVEELVQSAPSLDRWRFIAFKPALDIKDVIIVMNGYEFNESNLSFYAIEERNYPDEVDIVMVYDNYKAADHGVISNGVYIFLDNFLGELNHITSIDNLTVISKQQANKDLIPVAKMKEYLVWREKEFIEKYDGIRYDTDNDSYSSFEAEQENSFPLIAIINTTLLDWNSKASHPWIMTIEISYTGDENNGMPDETTYELMDAFEEEIMNELKDHDGYLNIGRQTSNNTREIYFACKDFRKPSKVLHRLIKEYESRLEVGFLFYKDKYWQSFERFSVN